MARPKLTVYLDVVSPFGYMAFYMTRNSPIFQQCDITYIPIFLGGIMQACGNTPPINVKNKNEYITADRIRLSKLLNIPIVSQVPTPFPPNTLPAQRALSTIQAHHPSLLPSAFETLYQAFWVEGQPIGEPEIVAKALTKVLGDETAKEIVAGTKREEVKRLLSENTKEAFEAGVFGVPFFVARDGEGRESVFFGVDRLGMVADFLGLGRGDGRVGAMRALL